MTYNIDRAAVIGAGVMGATLAAHLANAGIPTLLLDIVPPDDSGVEGDPSSRDYRDAFARTGLKKALTANPQAFYTKDQARLVTPGNMEDDIQQLREVDWVLEAVPETLALKEAVFKQIEPVNLGGTKRQVNLGGGGSAIEIPIATTGADGLFRPQLAAAS